jgi:hypothetical protein
MLVRGYDHGVILRCTRKLLRLLGTKPAADPGPAPDAEDWYANLLWYDRRKCLLLTHAGTLFTAFEADVRAADLRDTYGLVTGLIGCEPAREGLPAATFGPLEAQELLPLCVDIGLMPVKRLPSRSGYSARHQDSPACRA